MAAHIGCSPHVAATGFHPLDGARYLRDLEHADTYLCRLVAHHSRAIVEAEERGLRNELTHEFPSPRGDLIHELTYCDMTTGPDGAAISVDRRIANIHQRYDPRHVVSRSITHATPRLLAAVARVEHLKRGDPQAPPRARWPHAGSAASHALLLLVASGGR